MCDEKIAETDFKGVYLCIVLYETIVCRERTAPESVVCVLLPRSSNLATPEERGGRENTRGDPRMLQYYRLKVSLISYTAQHSKLASHLIHVNLSTWCLAL